MSNAMAFQKNMSKLVVFVVTSNHDSQEIEILKQETRCEYRLMPKYDVQDSDCTIAHLNKLSNAINSSIKSADIVIIFDEPSTALDAAYVRGACAVLMKPVYILDDSGFMAFQKTKTSVLQYSYDLRYYSTIDHIKKHITELIDSIVRNS